MVYQSVIAVAAGMALLAAAPPPPPPARSSADDSPVRCRTGDDGEAIVAKSGFTRRSRSGAVMNAPPPSLSTVAPSPIAPPPAPAPLPPEPSAMGARAPSIVRTPVFTPPGQPPYGAAGNTERYAGEAVASIKNSATTPVSTFSVDVDTGAYANVRRFLNKGEPVPAAAVRTEEMINYFRYDYPRPTDRRQPFSVTTDVARTPWNPNTRLLRVGLRADAVATAARPAANIVFLVDTSGSMNTPDKLPLVKDALRGLAKRLRADDRVSIVAYAGSAGVVLEPTSQTRYIDAALDCLAAGGSTAGGEGIELAYSLARAHFRRGGVNRIFLATDGDFNVGVSDNATLEALVKRNRDTGITLTTLGFGTGNYNEAMMERIADVGNGNYAYIDSAQEADKVLGDELSATLVTVAQDVKIQVEFNPAQVSQYRLIGYENRALREEDFTNDAVDAGDVGAGHQVTALYEVVPAGAAGWTPSRRYPANRAAPTAGGSEACEVRLRYKLPGETTSRALSRVVPATALRNARAPTGDMAFVTAVAAYGQRLRGDTYLGRFGMADVTRLAGPQRDPVRQEFITLAGLAGQAKD